MTGYVGSAALLSDLRWRRITRQYVLGVPTLIGYLCRCSRLWEGVGYRYLNVCTVDLGLRFTQVSGPVTEECRRTPTQYVIR